MRSQESLNELRYLRRLEEEVEDQWRAPRPDLDRLHRVMALLYTGHGLVWKSQGCSGSGEHDPFASELVDLALPIERAAQPAVQNGAHRAFNRFEDWRCEACGWNANALYTQWTTTAANGDPFRPLDVINDQPHPPRTRPARPRPTPPRVPGPQTPRRPSPPRSQHKNRRAPGSLYHRRPPQ